ncbi:MAG: hypothetical protein SGJ09_04155 [Phycisphaerae bacterium]|nr:hypothetical protein [Phycisphaerae bacterium]
MSRLPQLAIVVSPRRAAEERSSVRRLATALLSEGAGITLFEPRAARDADATQPVPERPERRFELPRRTLYDARVPFWLKRARVERLAQSCERAMPDLVWCCGADGWPLAIELAEALDRPVALDFRCWDELRGATKVVRNERVVALVAPCEALARVARGVVPEPLVRLVPLGVRVPDAEPAEDSSRASVILVLTERGTGPAVTAALSAVKTACERLPDMLALVECDSAQHAQVWRTARSLGLLGRTTAVSRGALTSAAVEACDLLLLPETRGGPRLEALIALGRGVPVIASGDPYADTLIDGETAVVVPSGPGQARDWADAVSASIEHRDQALKLAARGRALVLFRHRSSAAAEALLAVARDVTQGGPLRISPSLAAAPRQVERDG